MRSALNILSEPLPPQSAVFVCANGNATTWREFAENVARCAAFFCARREPAFALFSENTELFATWFFALLAARKEVFLPPHAKAGILAPLAAACPTLVSDAAVPACVPRVLSPFPQELPPAPNVRFEPLVGRSVTFFTSGSTAEPKPIRKAFETLAAEVDFHARHADFAEFSGKTAPAFPPLFVASVRVNRMLGMLWHLLLPLALGASIDADFIGIPEEFAAKLRAAPHGNVFLTTSPTFLEKTLEAAEFCAFPPRACRRICTSGGVLRAPVAAGIERIFGVSPFEIFGSTETGGIASRRRAESDFWSVFPPVRLEVATETENAESAGTRVRVFSPFCVADGFLLSDALAPAAGEFAAFPRRFALRGRTDRLVKIAENRISLPEIEARFESHAFVSRTHALAPEGVPVRLGALIVPSATGRNFLKTAGTKRAFVAQIRADLEPLFESGAFPKKIRVINAIPTDAQGKIVRAEVSEFFENNLAEPILENVRRDGNAVRAEATFLADSVYFRGHFPTFPLLPGVAQVHFACVFARRFFAREICPMQISKLKFARMIFPCETVALELVLRSESAVEFAFKKGENLCSTGIFKIAVPENSAVPAGTPKGARVNV